MQLVQLLGGPEAVAEMTGRKHQLVKNADGTVTYERRAPGVPLDQINMVRIRCRSTLSLSLSSLTALEFSYGRLLALLQLHESLRAMQRSLQSTRYCV